MPILFRWEFQKVQRTALSWGCQPKPALSFWYSKELDHPPQSDALSSSHQRSSSSFPQQQSSNFLLWLWPYSPFLPVAYAYSHTCIEINVLQAFLWNPVNLSFAKRGSTCLLCIDLDIDRVYWAILFLDYIFSERGQTSSAPTHVCSAGWFTWTHETWELN